MEEDGSGEKEESKEYEFGKSKTKTSVQVPHIRDDYKYQNNVVSDRSSGMAVTQEEKVESRRKTDQGERGQRNRGGQYNYRTRNPDQMDPGGRLSAENPEQDPGGRLSAENPEQDPGGRLRAENPEQYPEGKLSAENPEQKDSSQPGQLHFLILIYV